MIKAVIFDMDGVLVDTELYYDQSRVEFLKELGYEIDPGIFDKLRGSTARHYWEFVTEHLKMPHPIEELIRDSRIAYLEFLKSKNIQPNPGVKELIEKLIKAKIRLIVASSASLRRIKIILEIIKLEDKFESIICGDDIEHSKPAPDIYLKAAEVLKLDPKECVAIEDATNGVKSAKSAGMKVIGYAGAPHNTQDLSESDQLIKKFSEVDLSKYD